MGELGQFTRPAEKGVFGLVETLFARVGKARTQLWSTQIVDDFRASIHVPPVYSTGSP